MTALGCHDLMIEAENCVAAMRGHLAQLAKLDLLPGVAAIGQFQPPIGLARIKRERGELWTPEPSGALAMVIPACRDAIIEPWDRFELGTVDCIDLVAFNSREPERWAWRTGIAWALGEQLIEMGQDIRLVSTPLSWLRLGGEAACILDWSDSSPAWAYLRAARRLIVEDPILQKRLERRLRETQRLPRVEVDDAA